MNKQVGKICKTCCVEKPLEAFYPHKLCAQGVQPSCKLCVNTKARAKRAALTEQQKKALNKANYQKYREQSLARAKIFAADNPAYRRAYNLEYYAEHKERLIAATAAYQRSHPELMRSWRKAWNEKNPDLYAALQRGCKQRSREALSDHYVLALLTNSDASKNDAYDRQTIELKKLQVTIKRGIRAMDAELSKVKV